MAKNAIITGAAMGMGFLMARKLAKQGWNVFAGVLPGSDTTELTEGCPTLTAIEQDVTSDESVKNSAAIVAEAVGDEGIHLIINNAGIANTAQGVIEGLSLDEMKFMFEVNTFGQLRVVQAFLPLMRKAGPGGRIINFASGAIVVNPPAAGAYNMSKHAVHGMTMALRHELATLGIQATSILPGGVKTAMTENPHESTKVIWDKVSQEIRDVYEPFLRETTTKVLPDMLVKSGNDPDYLTDEVLRIAQLPKLKPSYLVGKDVTLMKPMRVLMTEGQLEGLVRSQFKIPSKA